MEMTHVIDSDEDIEFSGGNAPQQSSFANISHGVLPVPTTMQVSMARPVVTMPETACPRTPPDSEFSASMLALLPGNRKLKRKSAFDFGASPKRPSQSPLNDSQVPDGASQKCPSQTPLNDSQVPNGASPKGPSQSPNNDSQLPNCYFDDAKTLILGDETPSQDDIDENVTSTGAPTGGDGAKKEADEIENKKDVQVVKNDAEDDKKGVEPEVDDKKVAFDKEEDLLRDPRFKKGSRLADFSPQGQAQLKEVRRLRAIENSNVWRNKFQSKGVPKNPAEPPPVAAAPEAAAEESSSSSSRPLTLKDARVP